LVDQFVVNFLIAIISN